MSDTKDRRRPPGRPRLAAALALCLALGSAGCAAAVARLGMSSSPSARYRVEDMSLVRFLSERPGLAERAGDGYVLYYWEGMPPDELARVAERVERARAHVEHALERPFAQPVSIYLPRPGSVTDSTMPIRRTNGFSATFGDEIFTLVRSPYPEGTIRHELVHCLFNGMGRQSSWIEEGLAELISSPDGARPGLLEILLEFGPVGWEELAEFDDGHDPSLRKRATAWMLVLVLGERHGLGAGAIADADTLEDVTSPEEAWAWLRERLGPHLPPAFEAR